MSHRTHSVSSKGLACQSWAPRLVPQKVPRQGSRKSPLVNLAQGAAAQAAQPQLALLLSSAKIRGVTVTGQPVSRHAKAD